MPMWSEPYIWPSSCVGIEHAADVVGGDHFHEPAVVVEDGDLRGEAVGEMRLRAARFVEVVAELRRVGAHPLADERLADEVGQRFARDRARP